MHEEMVLIPVLTRELLIASQECAFVLLVLHMSVYMVFQMGWRNERLLALWALIRSFASLRVKILTWTRR